MKYLSEFHNINIIRKLARDIRDTVREREITLMEVCGTHTMAIARYGIRSLLPDSLRLISGPGCPVCVTPVSYIDQAIFIARQADVMITTFGDMMRVPGSESSLEKERARGADIRIVTSTMEALALAEEKKEKKIVFLGVGFETTIPTVGVVIRTAKKLNVQNFYVLSSHKIMPPAMTALCEGDVALDGFLCPGHVSTITGTDSYGPIARNYKKGCVIAGFEPVDVLQAVLMLCRQIIAGRPEVRNQYRRVVRPEGNPKAKAVIQDVFENCDAEWRGLGFIRESGLSIRCEYAFADASIHFDIPRKKTEEPAGCRCGDVLRGRIAPEACGLFGTACTPDSPVGACMVSSEGSCAAAYRYRSG